MTLYAPSLPVTPTMGESLPIIHTVEKVAAGVFVAGMIGMLVIVGISWGTYRVIKHTFNDVKRDVKRLHLPNN